MLLILDEPTTGLDPANRLDLWAYLRELVKEGATVLLTTQYLEEADQLAEDIVVIDHGASSRTVRRLELKQRFAGDVLDVTVADADDARSRRRAARGLGSETTERRPCDQQGDASRCPTASAPDRRGAPARRRAG